MPHEEMAVDTVLLIDDTAAVRRAASRLWTAHAGRCRGAGPRRTSRATTVLALMAAVATTCIKMLALNQQPQQTGGKDAASVPAGLLLLQAQAQRRSRLAVHARAAGQELIFEPLRKIYGNPLGKSNGTRLELQSPFIFDQSYAHYSTPRLPPLTPHTLLAGSQSFGAAVERDGEYALQNAGLEIRRVAEQMLLPKFQPDWLRGVRAGQEVSVRLRAAGGNSTTLRARSAAAVYGTAKKAKKLDKGQRSSLGERGAGVLSPIKFLQPVQQDGDPEIRQFMHNYRHGIEDENNTAYQEIEQADRVVTEPDDIVKMQNEVRRLHKERVQQWERAEKAREEHKNSTANLPGVFRWFEDSIEGAVDNTTNLTLGTWVWCRNESAFANLSWHDGEVAGAPVMKPHQKFVSIEVRPGPAD